MMMLVMKQQMLTSVYLIVVDLCVTLRPDHVTVVDLCVTLRPDHVTVVFISL